MAGSKGTLNKVQLIGRLGQDPEMKYTPSGAAIAKLSLATNRSWKDESGKTVEKTDWHRIVAWRATAEIIGKYLKKGSQVYIEGRLETRSWEDDKSEKHYVTEVVAENILMLGGNGQSGAGIPLPDEPPETAKDNNALKNDNSNEADDLPF